MDETGTVVQPLIKVKSVTLTRGHWIYVCPCGFQYSVSWVPGQQANMLCIAFVVRGKTEDITRLWMKDWNLPRTGMAS